MAQHFHRGQSAPRHHYSVFVLSFVWLCGLAVGVIVHCIAGSVFASLMRGILSESVSIFGLICVIVLPFLFSAFAVYIGLRWLLYPICFGKTMLVSLIASSVWVQFGSAGWLAWLLTMFSDMISLPLFYRYCLRHVSGFRSFSFSELVVTFSACIFIGSVDYCYISPFLAMLSF